MSQCNYCRYKEIKQRAKVEKKKVTKLAAHWGMGGVSIYVHPTNVKISELPGGEDGERAKYRQVWFMEIGKSCEC